MLIILPTTSSNVIKELAHHSVVKIGQFGTPLQMRSIPSDVFIVLENPSVEVVSLLPSFINDVVIHDYISEEALQLLRANIAIRLSGKACGLDYLIKEKQKRDSKEFLDRENVSKVNSSLKDVVYISDNAEVQDVNNPPKLDPDFPWLDDLVALPPYHESLGQEEAPTNLETYESGIPLLFSPIVLGPLISLPSELPSDNTKALQQKIDEQEAELLRNKESIERENKLIINLQSQAADQYQRQQFIIKDLEAQLISFRRTQATTISPKEKEDALLAQVSLLTSQINKAKERLELLETKLKAVQNSPISEPLEPLFPLDLSPRNPKEFVTPLSPPSGNSIATQMNIKLGPIKPFHERVETTENALPTKKNRHSFESYSPGFFVLAEPTESKNDENVGILEFM